MLKVQILVLFAVLVCLPAFIAGKGRVPGAKNGRRGRQPPTTAEGAVAPALDCGPWVENPCSAPTGAVCGVGSKVWNRTGTNCSVVAKTFRCKIPCDNVRIPKSACKYNMSDWSICDPTTNLMTRTATLKVKRRGPPADAACEQTKTLTRNCPAVADTLPGANNNKRDRVRVRARPSQP